MTEIETKGENVWNQTVVMCLCCCHADNPHTYRHASQLLESISETFKALFFHPLPNRLS